MSLYEEIKKERENKTGLGVYDTVAMEKAYRYIQPKFEDIQSEGQRVYNTYKSRFFDENEEYKNTYRSDTEDALNKYKKFKYKYDNVSKEVLSYLNKYGSQLDEKYVTDIKDWLKSSGEGFDKIHTAYKYDYETLSQYKNESEYKKALAEQKVFDETRDKMLKYDTAKAQSELNDLYEIKGKVKKAEYLLARYAGETPDLSLLDEEQRETYLEYQPYLDKYGSLAKVEEQIANKKSFIEEAKKYQKAVADAKALEDLMKTPEYAIDAQKGWEQYLKDEEAAKAENEKSWWEIALEGMAARDTTMSGAMLGQVYDIYREDRSYLLPNDNWSQDEKNLFGYYYLNDRDKAWEFGEQTNNEINRTLKEEERKAVEESAMSGVGANIGHQGLSILGTMTGFADYLSDILEYSARGTITEKKGLSPYEYAQTVRDVTGEYLNDAVGTLPDSIPIIGGKGLGDAYQLGTSIIDSAASTYTMGAFGTAVTFFGSAAASAVDDAKARGASDEQALLYGTFLGAAEAVSEYIGAEKLLNIGSSKTLKEAFIKLGTSEGIEEGVTALLGRFADDIVMGDMSEYRSKIRNYMLYHGMSQEEAAKKAFLELAEGVAYDTIGGFISGEVHASAAHTVKNAVNTVGGRVASGTKIKDAGQTANLVEQAKSLGDDTKAAKLAGKITDKTGAYKVGKLYDLTGAEVSSQNRADIIKSLERKGYKSKEAASIADSMLSKNKKTVMGEYGDVKYTNLTETYKDILENEKSTVNRRNAGYNSISQGVHDYRDIKNQAETKSGQEIKSAEGNSKSIEETAIERKFKASEDGKAINNATGKLVDIEEIASIEDGKMTLKVKNNDGTVETVDADSVSFATDEENVIYSAVLGMGVDAATANDIIGDYKQSGNNLSATRYALGIDEAYRFGLFSLPVKEMTTEGFSAALSEKSKTLAYNLGKERGNAITTERQAIVNSMAKDGAKKKKGKVHFEGDRMALTKIQRESLNGIEVLSQALGTEIHIYESYVLNGKRVYKDTNGVVKSAPNGKYYQKDGSIWIDLNAGNFGQGTMLYTVAHELTHFIKQWSPVKFKILADFLVEQYGEKGVSVDTLVKRQIEKAKNNDRTIDYETAFEEFVADSMTSMLIDGKVIKELYKKDKGLFNKIKSWIDDALRKIKEAYKGYEIETDEGRIVRDMKDSFEKIQSLFAEALSDASENFAAADIQEQKNTTDEGDVKFEIRYPQFEAADFERNIVLLSKMQPVKNLSGNEFAKSDKPLSERVMDYFNSLNNNVYSDLFGDVALTNASMRDDIYGHGRTKQKITAFAAIKEVIQQGVVIDSQRRGNGNYDRIVVAAPITIAQEKYFMGVMLQRDYQSQRLYLHDVVAVNEKETIQSSSTTPFTSEVEHDNDSLYMTSILKKALNVKENSVKNSDRDNLGNTLTSEQAEFFKDSVVRDEKGNLKVMYRGDASEFTVFDRKKSKSANLYGRGFYFTDSDSHAGQYGKTRAFYLDIKSPLSPGQNNITKSQMLNFLKAIENDGEDFDLYNYGQDATAESVLKSIWGKGDFEMLQDVNATAIGDLVAAIELFNEINGTAYDGVILPTETVTFNSEQAKLTSNQNPTSDKDIRFSMRDKVEETKDLVAVHNLTEEKLLKSLQLGGLPMPSIAIARAKEGYSAFGRISLVFNKDTIDPQNNRNNKVYSGDAWTPTYPKIDYKISRDVVNKAWDKISELLAGTDYETAFGYLGIDTDNITDRLNRNGGTMYDAYGDKPALKLAYLKDNGIELELPKKQKDLSSRFANEVVIRFAEKYGEEKIREINQADTTLAFEKYIPEIKDIADDYYSNLVGEKMDWQIDLHDVYDIVDASLEYFRKGIQSKTENSSATSKMIDEAVDEAGYEKWLNDLYKGVIEKEGIRNNQDMFTPSGNRRSFEALHYEHNLENVIKAMKSKGEKGIGFGGGNIFGAVTTEYKSISDIKDASNTRMQNLSQDEYDAMRQDFTHRFFELASSLPIHKDSFTATDDAAEMLIEAVIKFKTKSGMANYLRSESKGWANYSDYVVDDLIQLVNEIRQMPVGYFEAKPQRAVGFNEVATAIIPNNSSAELKTKLADSGVKFIEYENGNEQSRLEALNSLEDVKFSDRDPDAISTRSLLANALETAAQNDLERAKLNEYKSKIEEMAKQEQKLTELRSQIKEISFSKGPRDKDKLKKLQDEAIKTANRIDNYDKMLLRLEAAKPLQNVLEREKQKATKRQKAKDAEIFKTYRDNKEKTLTRHKIKRVVNELNQYLLRGSKDKHVMVELQKSVALALDAVNMDTVGAEERVAKYNELIAMATDPDVIASLTETRDRIQQMGDRMKDKLTALKSAYEGIKSSEDPDVANAYDEVIMVAIDNVVKEVGNTSLRNMSQSQLDSVYDMYTMILTRVRGANKSFKSAKNEDISTRGGKTITEVEKVGGSHSKTVKALKGIKNFAWNALKPVTAFNVIGSRTLSEAFNNVRKGEDTWAVDVNEAKKFYQENVKKYKYDSWDFKKKYSFTSTSGISFELTLEQMMALYAYSKREQADEHLQYGGFVFDDSIEVKEKTKLGIPIKYEVNTANAHNISKVTLMQIIKNLSAEQRAFVDVMQDYLSTTMGAKGNEVSTAMYGVKLFKEKHYFPLKSAKQFMFEQNQVAGEVRIKNAGFTKETMPHAKNPIILSNFTDVWANHVNDMSMYHAFTLALEDFNRIFNYKTLVSEDFGTQSVKSALQNAYEKQCVDYIKELITDLNGGARVDSRAGIINKGIGKFKKAAVFASASVVIQQPSAFARAFAYIDKKYFMTKPGLKNHKALWEEVKKYAPVAIIKEMGYFDTHMGMQTTEWIKSKEYDGFKNKAKGAITDSNYRDELLSKAPAWADEVTWCYIWQAVKHETDKTTNLQPGTEEFLKRCGERFTEVITNTQVYDSVLSRSGMMRSKDTGMKMATAFMAEPTTSLNILVNGIVQGVRGNKSFTRKSIGAVVSSLLLNSILVSLVYAARDDDDDETYIEKYVSTLTDRTIDSLVPFNLIPFVKDIWSIVQGYDVERSDMTVIGDVWNGFTSLSSEKKTPYRKVEDFAGSLCAIFGLPVKNIMRDARALYNLISKDFF